MTSACGKGTAFSRRTAAAMRSTRRIISAAARRENVSSSMRRGSAPLTMRCATRWASVLVLPEPAPAMIKQRTGRQKLRLAVFDGAPLLGIEPVEIGGGHARGRGKALPPLAARTAPVWKSALAAIAAPG